MSFEFATAVRRRWPDPDQGPWAIQVYVGRVDGRLGVVGIELFAASVRSKASDQAVEQWLVSSLDPDHVVPIRAVDMRLPLGAFLDTVRHSTWLEETIDQLVADGMSESWADEQREILKSARYGRLDLSDEVTPRNVAKVYTEALRQGQHPTKAVQDHFRVSKSVAGKRVWRARQMGLLPPTTRGKAVASQRSKAEKQ